MRRMSPLRIGSLFAVLALLAGVSFAAGRPDWPQSKSDLPADPAITFGVLDNGMRYAIQHNAIPTGQVSLRLVIEAGSMQEAHDQEGLAHLLEHMAFHGSAHVADGETMRTLERLGMRLGPDINAATSRNMTVYKFNLTKGDDNSVDTGLRLLREIAGELTLDPKLMDAERKVVLAEAHVQSAAQMQVESQVVAAMFGDHPFARAPIGRDEVIENAPAGRLRDFYDAYYRPERATVIVAGDIDPAALAVKIKAQFAGWRGRGKPGKDPAPIQPSRTGVEFRLLTIKGLDLGSQSLRFVYLHDDPPFRDSRSAADERLVYSIAATAAQLRFTELNQRAGRPFESGAIVAPMGVPFRIARGDLSGAGLVSDWKATLALLVRTRRQLLTYGLTQQEIDTATGLVRTQIEAWVARSAADPTPRLADGLVGDVGTGFVHRSPQQTLDLFNQIVVGLTADRADAVLRSHLGPQEPMVIYTTSQTPEGGEAALQAAYEKAAAEPVTPFEAAATKVWSDTAFGPPGTLVERRTDDSVGATFVRFANGVRLTVKSTDYAKGQVLVSVRFGHGQLDLPKDKVAASDFASRIIDMGGFRDMSDFDASRALLGKNVDILSRADEDAFVVSGPLQPPLPAQSFELEMQVLAAKFGAPGWRTDGWPGLIGSLANGDDANDASPLAVYDGKGLSLLHPGDMRWVVDTAAMRASWKADDAVAFIRPIFERALLEVIVVGDVTVDRAIAVVSKTLGSLPKRTDIKEPRGLRDVKFPGPTPQPLELHHNGAAYQALVVVNWPTADALANTRETQAARLLADIMEARAFDQIRNKEGHSYSPSVSASLSESLPGYGMISARILVKPEDVAATFADLDAIAADLANNDLSPDELARAQSARVAQAARSRRLNSYWLHYLEDAQTDPRLMGLAAREPTEIAALTATDIRAAARKWLVKEKSWRLMVTPQPK